MEPSSVVDLKAFVPARDYALAKQIAVRPLKPVMMSLNVEDVDAWWEHIERIHLKEKYPTIMAKPPALQPWGLRVLYLSDPTGVLWHITEARKG